MQATSMIAAPVVAPAVTNSIFVMPDNFPVVFEEQSVARIGAKLSSTHFSALSLRDVATLGSGAEKALHRSLDGFLSRIGKDESPHLFKLVDRLREAVEQEDLPGVAASILDSKPSLMERAIGLFNKKALRNAATKAYDEACRVAAGKSKRLSDHINGMEKEFEVELGKLIEEMKNLENVKLAYRERFYEFAEEAVFLTNLLHSARAEVAQLVASGASPQVIGDAQDKLQALESRALAIEGTLSRLPSDELVIRQLQNAGVATWQEVTTTASSRFGSIKMTLLAIHGARVTQDTQRLAKQGADLDKNLAAVRAQLMREVVTVAANAPGDNRLQQAQQLRLIVDDTKQLQSVVEQARQSNQQKFEQARAIFASARQEMLVLGNQIDPGRPLAV